MKKIYSLLLIIVFVAIYACRKELTGSQEEQGTELTIAVAKNHYRKLSNNSKANGVSVMTAPKDMTLLWGKAYQGKQRVTDYIEVPISAKRKRITYYNFPQDSLKYKPDASVGQWSMQRLVFIKNPGKEIKERILTFIPDKEYLIKRKAEMHLNSLRKIQPKFSGYLEYRDWAGKVVRILRIKDGKVVRRYTPPSVNKKGKNGASVMEIVCDEECYPVWDLVCEQTPGSEIDYDVTCTDTYLGDDCFPVNCYDDENNPEDPDPDPDPFDCIYYGTCEDEPEPNHLSKVLGNHNLTPGQLSKLNSELNNLLKDCIQNYLFNQLDNGPNINFSMNSSMNTNAGYDPATNTVSFKDESQINNQNLMEELFHAYQNNVAYSGGTAQYTTTGRANIEFEAEVVNDIYTAVSGQGAWAIIDVGYQNWIYSLLSPNDTFPNSYDLNFNSGFFNGYLNIWLQQNQSAYPNATISNQVSPMAMNNLLNNNPCSN